MYKLAINRPISTLMYVITLVVFGYMSFKSMPSALYPNVDFPIVTVQTTYAGAESTTIESQVTDKIEEAISRIGGVDSITSSSSEGVSIVMVKFFLERNIDEATNDVRDKVSAVKLPKDADSPLVSKLDIGGAPVINLFLTAKGDSINNLMLFADEKVKPTIQKINDVGAINIVGYKDREIKIFPDINALNKYGITIREINSIVENENVKIGGGKLISQTEEFTLKTKADALSIEELENIKIKEGLRLKDVARVEDSLSDAKSYASFNGVEGVMLEVQKISGTNTIDIIERVKKVVPELQGLAGEKYDVILLNDTSPFIIHSLTDVEFDLIYGAILAAIIVFVFLRNITITLVSALSIPSSIMGTFALMNYMGFDLNKMTLIGLTLAIGIIIDDAIVVIENIYKKMEEGMSKFEAAYEGTKEMAFTILAISAMLLAVFIPVSFMSGIVGKFFESFAMTVGFAIIISYSIALSFIPSLSARTLKKDESRFYNLTEPFFKLLEKIYEATLKVVLRFKYITIILVFIIFFASLSLFPKIGMDFIPKEDKAEFEIKIKADSAISLEEMIKKSKVIEDLVRKNPNVEYTTLSVGYNTSQEKHKSLIYVKLTEKTQRALNQEQIIQEFREALVPYKKDMFITASAIPNIKGTGVSVPYQIVLKSDSFEDLMSAKKNLTEYLAKKKGFADIDTNLDDPKPQIEINILRENASRLGISASQIAEAISIAFSSDLEISYFEQNGKQYNITLRFDDKNRVSVEDIKKLQLRAANGDLVYLDGLVEFKKGQTLATINHFDRQRQVTIYADLFGLDLGGAVGYTKAKIDELLPKSVVYRFTGFAEEMVKTGQAFSAAIGLSVILMFIILAILYESLIQPIIIMVSLPLSIIGVMLALYMSGLQFSLFVMIGFMLLMGMVGKNAVLLVDFANNAIAKGKSADEALIEAGEKRLRPILMTTIAMVFAMLPLALGTGLGSETKAPMAISIIGGLLSSMILTLLIVPVIYRLISPFDRWLRKFYEAKRVV
ncbi:MAG: acriflavin resistance protein [Sulfurimonas sp. RIFOXYD12_FULL_33_39]|uniref:efflux RND transporter permease subunit n=1 Tax=unclassified Sulfurimonas TaxID=2623549 RepID=UPI0008AB5C76|nr:MULTISPECIES: efflux RND transporter permease subunit [unclassified Sulfurimonas]OHE10169.1 MAG: acriflavin resistance protein [Sulfurimonas sp. RIFOXYD12_FULL_33_39]OHE14610.1 MAG: acriflavin resistance protein [Sulfurimonas sp. RIFOXYD2_FULL_34_21]DAB27432.1 MAG TPA: acriflavin resistance protein [Sulfurimonas sp. UBA10385]